MEYRNLHPWNVSIEDAVQIQKELRHKVSLIDDFGEIKLVAGVDVSVPSGTSVGRAAVVILTFPEFELIESRTSELPLPFPYIPGFLSFREVPVILPAIKALENIPDVLIVDGQGIAHPRGLGIAAHLGLFLDLPTIGCAKSHLYGKYTEPGIERGSTSPMLSNSDERIGDVVRTRTGVSPVYISPGNRISFDSAVKIILDCSPKYRLPEPIRAAHKTAGLK